MHGRKSTDSDSHILCRRACKHVRNWGGLQVALVSRP